MRYHNHNDRSEKVTFETALLRGLAPKYGLYTVDRKDVPKINIKTIKKMGEMNYADTSFRVLNPYLKEEFTGDKLEALLNKAYDPRKITADVQYVTGNSNILWLTKGPTYSFKDYAARFYGQMLDHFLGKRNLRRVVAIATSGDTGGALSDALYELDNVDVVVFYPKGDITSEQRRQMTTLGKNIYAFEVNGDFDVCQALAKALLDDKEFAERAFNDRNRMTSANSISLGRLLPQSVYPFFGYSRIADGEKMITSIPSGNFGDMMGTVLAKEMGLPISKILVGLNPNRPFMDFMNTEEYKVLNSIETPSSAMKVSHPSNLARLFDFYKGHMYDKREGKKVVHEGFITKMPDIEAMRKDFFVHSITNPEHFKIMKDVYEKHGIMLDPHGSVSWGTLEAYLAENKRDRGKPSLAYETADPGKFSAHVKKAIGITPPVPEGIKRQSDLEERIYSINSSPDIEEIANESGKTEKKLKLSQEQVEETMTKIKELRL